MQSQASAICSLESILLWKLLLFECLQTSNRVYLISLSSSNFQHPNYPFPRFSIVYQWIMEEISPLFLWHLSPISFIWCLILFWLALPCKRQWVSISYLPSVGQAWMCRAVLYFISCFLLYSVTLTEAVPYSDSSFCSSLDLFPALLHPCADRGQNLIHCSGLTGTPQAVGWCNYVGFLPTSFSPVPSIWFVFFTVNVHWGGVSMELFCNTRISFKKDSDDRPLCPTLNR